MEKFKEALQNCDTVKVILTGVGETEFSTKELYESIQELERLAEIGKATEKVLEKGFLIHDDFYQLPDAESLLNWYRAKE